MSYKSALFRECKLNGLSDKDTLNVINHFESKFDSADLIVPPSTIFALLMDDIKKTPKSRHQDHRDGSAILNDWKTRGRARVNGLRSDGGREQSDDYDAEINYGVEGGIKNYHQVKNNKMLKAANNRDECVGQSSGSLKPGEFNFSKRQLGGNGVPWWRMSQNHHERDDVFESSTGEAIECQRPSSYNMSSLHDAATSRLNSL